MGNQKCFSRNWVALNSEHARSRANIVVSLPGKSYIAVRQLRYRDKARECRGTGGRVCINLRLTDHLLSGLV
ncbi:hypothetical protein D3C78_1809390 [compost metagenome]